MIVWNLSEIFCASLWFILLLSSNSMGEWVDMCWCVCARCKIKITSILKRKRCRCVTREICLLLVYPGCQFTLGCQTFFSLALSFTLTTTTLLLLFFFLLYAYISIVGFVPCTLRAETAGSETPKKPWCWANLVFRVEPFVGPVTFVASTRACVHVCTAYTEQTEKPTQFSSFLFSSRVSLFSFDCHVVECCVPTV